MKMQRMLSLLLSLLLAACALNAGAWAEEGEYFLEKEPGCRQLTLYWSDPEADYAACDVWVWFPGRDGGGQIRKKRPEAARPVSLRVRHGLHTDHDAVRVNRGNHAERLK